MTGIAAKYPLTDRPRAVRRARPRVAAAVLTLPCLLAASAPALAASNQSDPVIEIILDLEDDNTAPSSTTVRHTAMGTGFEFTLYARPGDTGTDAVVALAEQAFAVVDDLDRRVSAWLPDSQTTYLNHHAAQAPARVSADLVRLIQTSQRIHAATGGAFDCTVGPLMALYGFYDGERTMPGPDRLAEALTLVGLDKVSVDPRAGTIAFAREGMRLDFGAIGKGLALDQAAELLRRGGVTRALLHAGTSTVVAIGAPPGARGWKVNIRHPYNDDAPLASVLLQDESLSTSGCYGALPAAEGGSPCDILDPRTGMPVDHTVSATAIAATGVETDGLSTAFLVMGAEAVRSYRDTHAGVRAIIVPRADTEQLTPEWIGFSTERYRREPTVKP